MDSEGTPGGVRHLPAPDEALVEAVRAGRERGALWRYETDDLDTNLVAFGAGAGVGEHVNAEVDVLLVGVSGSGMVVVDGREYRLTTGALVLVPKGAVRSIRAGDDHVAYATCHRRRQGLLPRASPSQL